MVKIPKLTKLKALNMFASLFIVFGLALLSTLAYYHHQDDRPAVKVVISPSQKQEQQLAVENAERNKNLVTGFPVSISVPGMRTALDMNVPVIPGIYNQKSNTWTLSDSSAMFATISTQPNNVTGNTFIYGHYRPNVFAYMHLIAPNTIATITTSNGYKFTYKYVKTYTVKPNQTSVLGYSVSPILTIQTCSGAFFQNRQMYIFNYMGYTKVS